MGRTSLCTLLRQQALDKEERSYRMLRVFCSCISREKRNMVNLLNASSSSSSSLKKRSKLHSVLLIVLGLVILSNYQTFRHKLRQDSSKATAASRHKDSHKERLSSVFCDVTDYRTDICYLRGDVRLKNSTVEVLDTSVPDEQIRHKIRPYTRKWESACMHTVSEITLKSTSKALACDIQHLVPGVVFSTGGYSGSLFHDFTDGLVPLFISCQRFRGEVVLLIKEHKGWWVRKYSRILSLLTKYQVVNLDKSNEVHCFPELVVGLRNHGDLQIKPTAGKEQLDGNPQMSDFQELLKAAFWKRRISQQTEPKQQQQHQQQPKLLFMARNDSRVLLNQNDTLELAREIGFLVEVLSPGPKADLSRIYQRVHSAQVLMGVHGAALTHFLFMKPGSILVQIVPLGLKWPSKTYFAKSAPKAGMTYIEYRVRPSESTLVDTHGWNHTLISNSDNALDLGWSELKKVYLDNQNVRLSLSRFKRTLQTAFELALTNSKAAM